MLLDRFIRRQTLTAVLTLQLMASLGTAAEPRLVLQVASGPIPENGRLSATAFFLNTTPSPVEFAPPTTIPWSADGGRVTGVLEINPSQPTQVTVAPGSFVQMEYSSPVPASWKGKVVIEIPSAGNVSFPVEIVSAPPSARADEALTTTTEVIETRREVPRRREQRQGEESPKGKIADDIHFEDPADSPGQTFFKKHFAAYEPMYFVWGPDRPNIKFQFSIRYRIINPDKEFTKYWSWLHGLNFAYSQTSLWDFDAPSSPFFDSSYRPELIWRASDIFHSDSCLWEQLNLQLGFMHESNGRDGDESRSLNIVYAKPTFIFGNPQKYFTSVSPRFWFYATDPTDDPDMKDYRGYMDLVIKTGWANSLQLAGTFRVGEAFDHGSMQLDLTYPTARLFGNLDVMLHLQYFNGYGESLLRYYERSWTLRGGISLFR